MSSVSVRIYFNSYPRLTPEWCRYQSEFTDARVRFHYIRGQTEAS